MSHEELAKTMEKVLVFEPHVSDTYHWNGFDIYLGDNNEVIVDGQIPLEVANSIYTNYPENPYGIITAGVTADKIDWNPNDWAEEGYIDGYIIHTIYGLELFLNEMLKYYLSREEKYVPSL